MLARRGHAAGGQPGLGPGVNYVTVRHQALMNHTVVNMAAILQSALCMVIVIAVAGCNSGSSANGNPRGESQVEEPTCYRDVKSEWESAGVSQNPNAALLNIGGELASKDETFEKCMPTGGARNRTN
jgi:hypothetical protein